VEAIGNARAKHSFHLWAYVSMPNHVHLLIWSAKADYSISAILQSTKQSVARKALICLREHKPAGLKQLATGQNIDRIVSGKTVAVMTETWPPQRHCPRLLITYITIQSRRI
jgi:REP element-mobilizing transposase RayT